MSKITEPAIIVWPMCQFQKDYQTFEKLGEGHYGKVFSARRKESNSKRNKDCRYVFNEFTSKNRFDIIFKDKLRFKANWTKTYFQNIEKTGMQIRKIGLPQNLFRVMDLLLVFGSEKKLTFCFL